MEVPAPAAGEVQIRVQAIGLNRAEIMYRNNKTGISGILVMKRLVVQAVGENVEAFTTGDLVSVIPSFYV